jgi:outer membrane protein
MQGYNPLSSTKRKYFKAAAIAFLVFSSPISLVHAEEPLTLEETLRYVYHESPSIVSARHSLKATQELYPQARAGWRPTIGAETNIVTSRIETGNFAQGDGATTKGASVNVEQPLFRGFRTVAETQAARERIEAESRRLEQIEQDTFLRAVESYMNVIRDRMLLDLQRKNVGLLGREKESVQARFDAGDVTKTDVQQTEARYADAQADDAIAQSTMQASEATFEEVTGFEPPEIMTMPEITFSFPDTMDDLVELAALQNPRLMRARTEHDAAETDIRAVKSDFYPQVTAFANHVKEYDPQPGIVDESESSTIGIRARISLYQGGSTLSRVREAKSRASQRFVEIREVEQALRSQILADWKRLKAYDAEIAARELEVTAVKYSAEGVREEARLGERTVLDTLEADQDVLDAESQLVEARSNRIVVAYRLAAGLGFLVPERLGFGPEIPQIAAD